MTKNNTEWQMLGASFVTKVKKVSSKEIAKTTLCHYYGDFVERAISQCGGCYSQDKQVFVV